MTWRMARELLAAGMTVGGHTVSHPILARLDEDAQRDEVFACRTRLEAELGIRCAGSATPTATAARSTRARGRSWPRPASSSPSPSTPGSCGAATPWDPYALPRIAVGPRTAGDAFAATVTLPQVFGSRR